MQGSESTKKPTGCVFFSLPKPCGTFTYRLLHLAGLAQILFQLQEQEKQIRRQLMVLELLKLSIEKEQLLRDLSTKIPSAALLLQQPPTEAGSTHMMLNTHGCRLLLAGKCQEAIETFEKAFHFCKTAGAGYLCHNTGVCYEQSGEYAIAEVMYTKAAENARRSYNGSREHASTLLCLARMLKANGKHGQSKRTAAEALQLFKNEKPG